MIILKKLMNKYLTLVPTNESQEKKMDYCGLKGEI